MSNFNFKVDTLYSIGLPANSIRRDRLIHPSG